MTFRTCCCLVILAAALLAAPRGLADPKCTATPEYVNLTPTVEKWFESDYPGKSVDLRMHTKVLRTTSGIAVQRREILLGDEVIEQHELLFSRDEDGDVYYHGDLTARVYATPVKWVDAPLTVGKSWVDHAPALDGASDPAQMIHFVFAVLEQENVQCPTGIYPAYRVLVTSVQPDGETTNCNFWYNDRCGLVRCCMENQRVYLLQKMIRDGDDSGRDLDDPLPLLLEGAAAAPNPSNPATEIRFRLAEASAVTVEIYDIAGRRVRTLCEDESMAGGERIVRWNGENDAGATAASGVYLYRVRAGRENAGGRVTLVR